MSKIKNAFKSIPFVLSSYKWLLNIKERGRLGRKPTAEIFSTIHRKNAWKGEHSVSGRGSDLHQTRNIITAIPRVCRDFKIRSILDVPCGDFHWMSNVQLVGIDYTGADIVPAIIQTNAATHQRESTRFMVKNLITDDLPVADLIFCRDCLVHLSFNDIKCAIKNMCRSGARYLMTTTFTDRVVNHDITTGQWRTLNLEKPPFSFPPPELLVREGCEEYGEEFSDKSLGLWTLESLRKTIYVAGHNVEPAVSDGNTSR